jgi:hypothetical protein
MSDPFSTRYGSITDEDADVMDACLGKACETFKPQSVLRVCEIGMFDGRTASGIKRKVQSLGMGVRYWGIDAGYITEPGIPFPEATVIKGRSEEVFNQVDPGIHLLFIDGCHCRNHVILDTLNYIGKVVVGGFVLFHDANPEAQGKDKQPCGSNIPEFYISVIQGIRLMCWPHPGWEFFMEKFKPGCPLGGIAAYRRIA